MEYSTHQKERIANHFLEFYKDGKYAYEEGLKRQSQTYYNRKSEIMKSLDRWCKTDDIVKWIIPILDYNLETDQESLEREWTKNHQMAIKVEDLENKYHRMEIHLEQEAKKLADKRMEEWISEKEDVATLHEEIEELKHRRSEMIRSHLRSTNHSVNENRRLEQSLTRMEDQLREKQFKEIESDLAETKEVPTLRKSVKKLTTENNKLEKENLKLQKQKMDAEMKYLELKTKTDSVIADLKTEKQKAQLEMEYYKIKGSVQVSPQQPHLPHQQVEEVQV